MLGVRVRRFVSFFLITSNTGSCRLCPQCTRRIRRTVWEAPVRLGKRPGPPTPRGATFCPHHPREEAVVLPGVAIFCDMNPTWLSFCPITLSIFIYNPIYSQSERDTRCLQQGIEKRSDGCFATKRAQDRLTVSLYRNCARGYARGQ
jgi:hypothetical protein